MRGHQQKQPVSTYRPSSCEAPQSGGWGQARRLRATLWPVTRFQTIARTTRSLTRSWWALAWAQPAPVRAFSAFRGSRRTTSREHTRTKQVEPRSCYELGGVKTGAKTREGMEKKISQTFGRDGIVRDSVVWRTFSARLWGCGRTGSKPQTNTRRLRNGIGLPETSLQCQQEVQAMHVRASAHTRFLEFLDATLEKLQLLLIVCACCLVRHGRHRLGRKPFALWC